MSDHLLPALDTERSAVYHADLFTLCASMPDQSVDMILADLPYGTTACSWDTVIPFEPMWAAFKRIIKPRGAIVLTASQPFTSALVMSNVHMFHEELIWDKVAATGYLDANRKHLKQHEDILVFCDGVPDFAPQKMLGEPYIHRGRARNFDGYSSAAPTATLSNGQRFPKTILCYSASTAAYKRLHPTQKPVALFRYLIRTYTRAGELVFDPVVGSGTTALAARSEERRFIVGDSSAEYVEIARQRLTQPYTPDMFALAELEQQQGAD